jgi:hypothetical protein
MNNFTSYLFMPIIIFIGISSLCAKTPADSLNKNSQKYLSFYENAEGETVHWEANFFGDEITSIYKNGKRIPDDLLDDYKDKVYDELAEMRFGNQNFSFQMPVITGHDFKFDMDEFHRDLEELEKELPKHKEHFKLQIDAGSIRRTLGKGRIYWSRAITVSRKPGICEETCRSRRSQAESPPSGGL